MKSNIKKLFKIKDYTISTDKRQYIITGDGVTKYKPTIESALDRIAVEYEKKEDYKDIEDYIKKVEKLRKDFLKEVDKIIKVKGTDYNRL